MVARHRFVQRQRRKLVIRTLIEARCVHPICARLAERGAALCVVSRRRTLGLLRWDHANAVRKARQRAEQARQLPIRTLCDFRSAIDELLRRACVELRVGAQEALECGEIAAEAAGADLFLHGGANARDLGEPKLVDFLGRHLGRRVRAHEVAIEVLATRHGAQADAWAGSRQIFALDERHGLTMHGQDALANDSAGALAVLFLLRRRNVARHRGERRQ